jgi:hypothetical protein
MGFAIHGLDSEMYFKELVFHLFAVDLPAITVEFAGFYRDSVILASRRAIPYCNPSEEKFIDVDEKRKKFFDHCPYRPWQVDAG